MYTIVWIIKKNRIFGLRDSSWICWTKHLDASVEFYEETKAKSELTGTIDRFARTVSKSTRSGGERRRRGEPVYLDPAEI